MRIIIVGAGKIGYILAAQLSKEGHGVTIVDKSLAVLREVQNELDVAMVAGNGACAEVQREAGIAQADLLIAVTASDEVNILCGLVARKLGCRNNIARIRNPEYDRQLRLLGEGLGISLTINPEKTTANEIFHLLQFPSFLKRDSFAGGRADMVEFYLSVDSPLANKKLSQMGDLMRFQAIVCAAERAGEVVIPSGEFVLMPGDKLLVAAPPKELSKIAAAFGMPTVHIKHVMLVGGSNIAVYLAQLLAESHISVKLIEDSEERCRALETLLPEASIICGNGTDQKLLLDESIRDMDAVVSLTGVDEENFLISMFAHYVGVPKTVTKNNRIEYSDIFRGTGIDTIVSPKYLTAGQIVRYVRAAHASKEGSVETLYRILDDKAEALGFTVPAEGAFIDRPFGSLHFRKNTLIALILRDRQVIIPRGTDCMRAGDSIIAVTKPEYAISELSDLFDAKAENGAK